MTFNGHQLSRAKCRSPPVRCRMPISQRSRADSRQDRDRHQRAKRSMLVSRLSRRCASSDCDFGATADLLDSAAGDAEHARSFRRSRPTSRVSFANRDTSRRLAGHGARNSKRAAAGERIRIWSAGCSSGEEPYSIAMTLKENWPTMGRADLKDPGDRHRSRHGRRGPPRLYTGTAGRGRSPRPSATEHHRNAGWRRIRRRPVAEGKLRFEEFNLLGPWPFNGMFDVIFCRNVVIYFDAPTRMACGAASPNACVPGARFSSAIRNGSMPIWNPCSNQRASPSTAVRSRPVRIRSRAGNPDRTSTNTKETSGRTCP
jgi:chemotaxis protein methyltransferase CheR